MVLVNATVEIDKAGRIVVPKKMRDALHLVPGTRLTLKQEGDAIQIAPERVGRGLYRKNGMLVYDTGRPVPPEALNWVRDAQEARAEEIMGPWNKD